MSDFWEEYSRKCPNCKGILEDPDDFGECMCMCGWWGYPDKNENEVKNGN